MSKWVEDNSLSVGRTPLVRIDRINEGAGATVFAKIEGQDPACSVKCRIGAASNMETHHSRRFELKTTLIVSLLAVLFILSASAGALAAVDSVDILIKALIDQKVIAEDSAASIRAEIATLRQDEDKARKSFNVTGKTPIKINGYFQQRYTHYTQDGVSDSFETKRLRLLLSGDATPDIFYNLQLELAGSSKALTQATLAGTPPTLTTKTGSFSKPLLLDAVAGYKLPGDRRISIGQFKTPFGLEFLTAASSTDAINSPRVIGSLVPGYDTGIQYSGAKPLNDGGTRQITYAFGLFNGAGINTGDDNEHKDLAGRLVLKPGIEGLSLGLAHYSGRATATKTTRDRTGVEAVYVRTPWTVKGEYISGKDGLTKKNGWYTTAIRQVNDKSQAVVRYDTYEPNKSVADDGSNTLTLGYNYFFNKDGYSRLQLNWEKHTEEGPSKDDDLFLAQFQAGF